MQRRNFLKSCGAALVAPASLAGGAGAAVAVDMAQAGSERTAIVVVVPRITAALQGTGASLRALGDSARKAQTAWAGWTHMGRCMAEKLPARTVGPALSGPVDIYIKPYEEEKEVIPNTPT